MIIKTCFTELLIHRYHIDHWHARSYLWSLKVHNPNKASDLVNRGISLYQILHWPMRQGAAYSGGRGYSGDIREPTWCNGSTLAMPEMWVWFPLYAQYFPFSSHPWFKSYIYAFIKAALFDEHIEYILSWYVASISVNMLLSYIILILGSTSPCPILIMPNTRLDCDKYQF